MAYLGSTPTTQSFIAGTDTFSGTGAQVAFTLTRAVNSVNDILVVVNNVDQQPSAYSVSGTTLTFTAAPSSGTNNVYVRYLSTTLQSISVGDSSVTPAKLVLGTYDIDISGNAGTVTDGMYLSENQTITTGRKLFSASDSGMATATSSLNTLEILGTGGAAMMTFHRPGSFAGYFGMDSDNVFKVGGWSYGAVAYPLLYTGSTTAPGTAPVYASRAWVNFNGTGTVAIRASGNVSSITDNGTGVYTVNLTTSLVDTNYCVTGATGNGNTNVGVLISQGGTLTTSSFTIRVVSLSGTAVDRAYNNVSIFR